MMNGLIMMVKRLIYHKKILNEHDKWKCEMAFLYLVAKIGIAINIALLILLVVINI